MRFRHQSPNVCITGLELPLPISPELLHSPGGKLITSSPFNFRFLISADDFYSSISGHTAVNVGKSMVVVFGGLVDKKFLNDIIVYDIGTIILKP